MASDRKGTERREHERLPCKGVLLTYERQNFWAKIGLSRKGSKPCPVRNITRNGLCFLSRESLKTGESLNLTIQFGPNKPVITVEGKVAWCGNGEGIYPHKMGLGFVNVSGKSWDVLSNVEQYVLKKEAWEAWRLGAKERSAKMWGTREDKG